MELAECGGFCDDVTAPRVPLRFTRATQLKNSVKIKRGVTMDIETVFKLLAIMLWPFLLVFLYYLFDRKGFKKQLEKLKKEGWS